MSVRTRERPSLHFFAWDPFRWQVETAHLSALAEAALRRIIDDSFRRAQDTGDIEDDDAVLCAVARVSAEEWSKIRIELIDSGRPLLLKKNGRLYHPMLQEEIEISKRRSKTARENRRGGRQNARSTSEHLATDNGETVVEQQSHTSPEFVPETKTKTKNETEREIEEVSTTGGVVDEDPESMLIRVARRMIPHLEITRGHVVGWLERFRDPFWIAAAICESELSLRAGKKLGYVTGMLSTKAAEGWDCEDSRGYVRLRMSSSPANADPTKSSPDARPDGGGSIGFGGEIGLSRSGTIAPRLDLAQTIGFRNG